MFAVTPKAALAAALVAGLASVVGCGQVLTSGELGWVGGTARPSVGQGPVHVQWTERLTEPGTGSYQPVEHAVAALDPSHDRVYVGSSAGSLWALTPAGTKIWRYDAEGGIEAEPAVDGRNGEVYLGTTQGYVHALHASDGRVRWRKPIEGAIRNPPILSGDAVYVNTASDLVVAFSRESGEALWRYHRDPPDGFSLTGHAGMVLVDNKLLAAFSDGTLVALDPADGHVVWERDTALDLEEAPEGATRFLDVDTTPVVLGSSVYIASFAAGFYEVALSSGSVRARDAARVGITSIAVSDRARSTEGEEGFMVLASADDGVVCLAMPDRTQMWAHHVSRGAASIPKIYRDVVLVGENSGGFLALAVGTGQELSRVESGYGFSAEPAIADHLGFVVSNGGTLFAFSVVD